MSCANVDRIPLLQQHLRLLPGLQENNLKIVQTMQNKKENVTGHQDGVRHIKINNDKYEWPNQYILGSEIRKLGRIPSTDDIFLTVKKPGEDEPIHDDTKVDLDKPGTEHFYSESKEKEIIIIVDGEEHKWNKKQISFAEVIVLAFGQYIDKPTMVYTVAYEDGPKQNPEGSMVKGQVVFVKNRMIFHATATDKS